MAKRKTKKEKIVDLKQKPEKITNIELSKVQQTINNINRIQLELGILETRKHNLLHNIAAVQDELAVMQGEFEKEYGTTDINIQTGEINYPSENQNPEENGKTDKKD